MNQMTSHSVTRRTVARSFTLHKRSGTVFDTLPSLKLIESSFCEQCKVSVYSGVLLIKLVSYE